MARDQAYREAEKEIEETRHSTLDVMYHLLYQIFLNSESGSIVRNLEE